MAVHIGSFKLGMGAFHLTGIIRAGGASSNLQSRVKGERSRVCPSGKAEKIEDPNKKHKHLDTYTQNIK